VRVEPALRLTGEIAVPGDKSISHRAVLLAAICDGRTTIRGFGRSADTEATIAAVRALGVRVDELDEETLRVHGVGLRGLRAPVAPVECGNAGTLARLLAGILAGQAGKEFELVGDGSLSTRPMWRVADPLGRMGAQVDTRGGRLPLTIRGRPLSGITYKLPVASAQVKSAILFAGLNATGRTTVIETSPSRDHTERLFNGFGVPVKTDQDLSVSIDGPARLSGGAITVPGDVSSAAYFVAAAMRLPGSDLTIEGVGLNPTRAAFLDVLSSWGAEISVTDVENERNEPFGLIHVRGGINRNADERQRTLSGSMIPALIDELPLLAVVGSQIDGGIQIRDARELRLKESDRLATTAKNLRAMGAEVKEFEDGLAVSGPTKLRGTLVDSHLDHRIAMAFSVAALVAEGETQIDGSECVAISFPEFFSLLDSLAVR
jgi:3-phosphoshikimate 1-carboxyvinyltransferase